MWKLAVCNIRFFREEKLARLMRQVVLLLALTPHVVDAQQADLPPVLPPPSSGIAAPSVEPLLLAPPEQLTAEPSFADDVLKDSISEALESAPLVVENPPSWYHPAYWFGPAPWDVGVELGLNGSEGQNVAHSLRTGGHIRRKTDRWKLDSSLVYNRNNANGVETQNNALLDLRLDRMFKDSPWSMFLMHQTLYDEFQAFDVRVSFNNGLAYECDCGEAVDFLGRLGVGTSREFGGPDDEWARELLLGLEYAHQLTDMQRIAAKFDYFPEWEDFNDYRIVADIGWEIDLDRPKNLSLKLSVVDRYDSTPNGVQPNELNYSALLIWGL